MVTSVETLVRGGVHPPRDYQEIAVKCVVDAAIADKKRGKTGRRYYYVLPTGTGKTRILAMLVEYFQKYGRCLLVAHRIDLINQGVETFIREVPLCDVGVIMSERRDYTNRVCVGSIQTLKSNVVEEWLNSECTEGNGGRAAVSLILIDECHHVVPGSAYEALIEQVQVKYPRAVVVGCTATPYRADKLTMQEVLPRAVFQRTIPEMQQAGWLGPLSWSRIALPLDLKSVKTSSVNGEKDYNAEQLAAQVSPQSKYIVIATMAHLQTRPTLVFCCNVAHAQELAAAYRAAGIGAAACWSDMGTKERASVVSLWKAGIIQVVTNVGLFTEGFDYQPQGHNIHGLACLVIARPTMSPSLYLQMLGRGTRLKPKASDYKDCLVFDVGGNANLLDTKQISLAKVMPFIEEGTRTTETGLVVTPFGEEEKDEEKKKKKKQDVKLIRIQGALDVSWIAWGADSDSGILYTSLTRYQAAIAATDITEGQPAVPATFAVMIQKMDSGLYQGYILTAKEWGFVPEPVTEYAGTLSEQMLHVNHVLAQAGLKKLVDKNANWRKRPASDKQLAYLGKIGGMELLNYAIEMEWTQAQVGHYIDWHKIGSYAKRLQRGK